MDDIKKVCFGLTIVLTLFGLMLGANQDDYQFDLDGEKIEDCPSSLSCCPLRGHIFIRGDVLYWTPRITGLELDFGKTEIAEKIVDCTQFLATRESDLDPHFKWNTGYRAGAGYETDKCKIEGLWTHFRGNGKRHNHECFQEDSETTNHGKVKIKFDQIDLAFACNYHAACSLTFKPFAGVRAARIREHIKALLITEIALFPDTLALEKRAFDHKQKYWGVGPLFGVEGDWEIGCGFGLYGAVATSLLYGEYKVEFDDAEIFTAPVSKQIAGTNKRHTHAFDWNIDLAVGISWHTCICNQSEFTVKLGFEQHQYFNQNHLCVGRGDVSFTGGVFSIELSF